ncbi:mannosyltransferase [Zunongwangia sp. F363]|uniref:Mannosyltransferase n=1 Tax=Autumnicola tepida TaxID=3075595 RepID=A0ABU3C4N4_9FLAO|nr:mannosyltransferase [Zunongwangia sp. F363]MDT0641283.1 mannosyltransferase [Zunongwangia sp. F363]
MKEFLKYHTFSVLLLVSIAAFYLSFGYQLERIDFVKLITLYAALFLASFRFIQLEKGNYKLLAGAAIGFRLLFLLALPNLSQDFYRFIWDGRLLTEGINPFIELPAQIGSNILPDQTELLTGMGSLSAGNYSNYPPLNQFFFAVATFLSGKSILGALIIMRLFIIAADIGILYFGRKLLSALNLPEYRIFWFILNPFIIIELTGNLHFEGVMLFFLIWSLYLLQQKKWIWSAILLGLSISVKLLPLLLLPLMLKFFRRKESEDIPLLTGINLKRLLSFYAITLFTVTLTFLPFLSLEFLRNFSQSISLWFGKFEFNAGIFYVLRWIGFQLTGFNIIVYVGKLLPLVTLWILIKLAVKQDYLNLRSFLTISLFGISTYFFLSTTVHPWYLATPLLLSIFTPYRYIILWTLLVMLSYAAYNNPEFQENYWLLAVEYLSVFGFFGYELRKYKIARV